MGYTIYSYSTFSRSRFNSYFIRTFPFDVYSQIESADTKLVEEIGDSRFGLEASNILRYTTRYLS